MTKSNNITFCNLQITLQKLQKMLSDKITPYKIVFVYDIAIYLAPIVYPRAGTVNCLLIFQAAISYSDFYRLESHINCN